MGDEPGPSVLVVGEGSSPSVTGAPKVAQDHDIITVGPGIHGDGVELVERAFVPSEE